MKEKKNIDRLFQEQFKDFEAVPNPQLWLNIEAELKKDKKSRLLLPFWFRYSGIAAAFFLGMFSLKMYQKIDVKTIPHPFVNNSGLNQKSNSQKEKLPIDFKFIEKQLASKPATKPTKVAVNQSAVVLILKKETDTNQSKIQNLAEKVLVAKSAQKLVLATDNFILNQKQKEVNEPEEAIVEKKIQTPPVASTNLVENPTETTNELESILKDKSQDKSKTLASTKNRWEIAPNVAPVYLNSNTGRSAIDAQFANNPQTTDNAISYGLGVRYVVNQKLTLRTALNKVVLGYNTDQVSSSSIYAENNIQTIDLVQNNSLLANDAPISGGNTSSIGSSQQIVSLDRFYPETNSLNQKMGYYEWPLEMAYTIVDKKIGISLIGGFSTLFLNENKISLVNSQQNRVIGQANNLNKIHWSTNFGVGFKYQLIPSVQFHFEPLIKYQLNTFSKETASFNPVFLGLYTGINYRF